MITCVEVAGVLIEDEQAVNKMVVRIRPDNTERTSLVVNFSEGITN